MTTFSITQDNDRYFKDKEEEKEEKGKRRIRKRRGEI